MNASLARRRKQLPEVDIYAPTNGGQFNSFAADLSDRSGPGLEAATSYASNLAAFSAFVPTEESFQPQYTTYNMPYPQYHMQVADAIVQPLDPQLVDEKGTAQTGTQGKYIGYSSGVELLSDLLRVMSLPPSIPWPHLACDPFLAEMHYSAALAALPVPCRKTSSIMLDMYDQVISPLYPLYTRAELQVMLNDIYLNGIIARRDISECTANCFALVLGQVIAIFARQQPSLEKMANDCAIFTRSGLAEVFLKPSLCGLRYLVCILLTNHSRELADPVWYTSGMAVQMCVDLNLHIEVVSGTDTTTTKNTAGLTELELEERRRIFWTVYSIDRGLALAFGRPFSLSESVISCPYPTNVSTIALNRFKVRRLQSRIMQSHLSIQESGQTDLPFPNKEEQVLMHEVAQWCAGKVGEEAIQGGNTELLLLRRGITNRQSKTMLRAVEIVAQNMQLYRTEAASISRVEGLLLNHDIFVNLITALYIYKFDEHRIGLDIQTLYTWIEWMRPIFTQLSRQWSTARESLYLVECLFVRLQAGST